MTSNLIKRQFRFLSFFYIPVQAKTIENITWLFIHYFDGPFNTFCWL